MSEILLTQEVGSLAKPNWRVQPVTQGIITPEHFEQANIWAERLDLDPQEAENVLRTTQEALVDKGHLGAEDQAAIKLLAARYAVRLQEKAGLDILYDGEQDRPEMYQVAVEGTEGFAWRGRLRAFDNKSYKKAAVVASPSLGEPWHVLEYERLDELTDRQIKVPITGAYTVAAWSYDEHYHGDREQFVLDLARNVIRPNLQALLDAGAKWIQIDEPAATTIPSEVELFVKAFNESVRGLDGKFSVHICFSDYSLLFPYIKDLENCSQFSLEFANKDGDDLGTDAANRPALEILQEFKTYTPESGIGLGVSDVHKNQIEKPLLVRDRVLRAVDILGDPRLVNPSPDCGLRTRTWEVAFDKLKTVVEGTNLARQELGG